MYQETITQRKLLANSIPPQTLNGSGNRKFTGAVDMSLVERAFFRLVVGTVTGGASLSAWLQESADNLTWTTNDTAGAFSNSGGANVSLTGLTTSSKEYTFEVRADQLTAGMRYVRLEVAETLGVNAVACATAEGDDAYHKPVSNSTNNGTQISTQNVVA